jgi:hypothetical protein
MNRDSHKPWGAGTSGATRDPAAPTAPQVITELSAQRLAGPPEQRQMTVEADNSSTSGVVAVARSRDGGANWSTVTAPGVGAYAFRVHDRG